MRVGPWNSAPRTVAGMPGPSRVIDHVVRAHDEQLPVRRLAAPELGRPAGDRQQGGRAHEAGDEAVGRAVVDVVGRAVLLDASGAHDRHPVTDGQRLGLVVGDEQGRRARRPQDVDDVGAQAVAQVRVEAGERLVEQHQPRGRGQRPGERDALALAAGQLVRVAIAEAGEADHAEPVVAPGQPLRSRQPAQPERDVVAHA